MKTKEAIVCDRGALVCVRFPRGVRARRLRGLVWRVDAAAQPQLRIELA